MNFATDASRSRHARAILRCVLAATLAGGGCSRAAEQQAPPPPVSAATSPSAAAPPPSSSESAPTPAVSSAAVSAAPIATPEVDVRAIGMHIGGGPNDDANKAPLLASIAPHHPALGRCWAALPNAPTVELGIDARVPGKGGRAKIEHPRSTVKDASFVACAVAVFTEIEFLPPKSGLDTIVSASLRLKRAPK